MVDLAQILAQVPGIASLPDSEASIIAQSTRSINMDSNLENWKQGLPSDLSLNNSSLLENELIAKQKVVLRLRKLLMRNFRTKSVADHSRVFKREDAHTSTIFTPSLYRTAFVANPSCLFLCCRC